MKVIMEVDKNGTGKARLIDNRTEENNVLEIPNIGKAEFDVEINKDLGIYSLRTPHFMMADTPVQVFDSEEEMKYEMVGLWGFLEGVINMLKHYNRR